MGVPLVGRGRRVGSGRVSGWVKRVVPLEKLYWSRIAINSVSCSSMGLGVVSAMVGDFVYV